MHPDTGSMTEPESIGLKTRLEKCISNKYPFAFYRLPDTTVIHFISQDSEAGTGGFNNEAGFVFSPFIESKEYPSYFIKADKQVELHLVDIENISLNINGLCSKHNTNKHATKAEHTANVAKAVEHIKKGALDKVILSRVEGIDFDADILNVFKRLCEKYESAFVSLVVIPGKTVWLTATPELLVSADGNKINTVSLAGTKPITGNAEWTDKEKKEQEVVTTYINDILKETCADITVSGPKDAIAGNVMHLKTEFSAILTIDLKALINKLHPTPAVCGLPKQAAIDFIVNTEVHQRKYYTGYLGPYTMNGKTDLFVNLRCAEILENKADVFVGGGITLGSNPEKEWDETVLKSKTLLSVMLQPKETV